MPRIQINCPRCRQPIVADIDRLFDVNQDPRAKQKLLSGGFNLVRCPHCGYEGPASVPIVYHDPEKELLLTYFPPELGVPVTEQEKTIGPLIKQVVDHLPQEQRKGYLFKPQTMLTMQTMVEKILEGDGVTKEMLENQQKRARLIERLITAAPDSRSEIIQQEEDLIDEEFFGLLVRLQQMTAGQGDQQGSKQLEELQKQLIAETKVGKEIGARSEEVNKAIKALDQASKEGLTREKLLDIIREVHSEAGLSMVVSLIRQGLDYSFFEMLTQKINSSSGDEKQSLSDLRTKLLEITQEIDKAVQKEMQNARQLLNKILAAQDVRKAIEENAGDINDLFIELANSDLESARKEGDLAKIGKLQEIISILQEMSAPPPEIALIQELISTENDDELQKILDEHAEEITPELLQLMNNIMVQQGENDELKDRLQKVYRAALKYIMKVNLQK
jgi:NTP pyrophosphatase (non-canonical NTP hydrolase)